MGEIVCSHTTEQEARACSCTGYGLGDLPCRCKRTRSQHENGTGRCLDPAARCHEFVLTLPEPALVTEQMIQAGAAALSAAIAAFPGDLTVEEMARAVLFSGSAVAMVRDWELAALRRSRDAYRDQVRFMTEQLQRMGVSPDGEQAQPV